MGHGEGGVSPRSRVCSVHPVARRTHGDLVSGLYHQILLSLQKVLADPVRPLCSHYGAVVGLHALGWKVREKRAMPSQRNPQPLRAAASLSVCLSVFSAGGGAGALPPPPHLLGQPAGRAGRLLGLQCPGQG